METVDCGAPPPDDKYLIIIDGSSLPIHTATPSGSLNSEGIESDSVRIGFQLIAPYYCVQDSELQYNERSNKHSACRPRSQWCVARHGVIRRACLFAEGDARSDSVV